MSLCHNSVLWPGGPGRLPAQGSHRSVRGRIRPYGSSSNPLRFTHDMTPRQTRQLLSAGVSVTPRESSKPPRCFSPSAWLPDASLPIPRVLAGRVPRLPWYYQGTATSCRPSRRASFPSLGGTTGTRSFRSRRRRAWQRRAWGWSPGGPGRDFFRGDDRISQVPGEPPFPFAHVLRPRPADAFLTVTERSRGPR